MTASRPSLATPDTEPMAPSSRAASQSCSPAGEYFATKGWPGVVIPGQPFVAKYSPAGEQLWLAALEEGAIGSVSGVASDGRDAVIVGYTSADWGAQNQGSFDSFVARVSAEGE